jgi:hypothetical protein
LAYEKVDLRILSICVSIGSKLLSEGIPLSWGNNQQYLFRVYVQNFSRKYVGLLSLRPLLFMTSGKMEKTFNRRKLCCPLRELRFEKTAMTVRFTTHRFEESHSPSHDAHELSRRSWAEFTVEKKQIIDKLLIS